MKFNIETGYDYSSREVRVGNVYRARGGRALKYGHMNIVIAITQNNTALMIMVDRDGEPVGVNYYGVHYLEDLCPCAFCEGLEGLNFIIRDL